MTKLLVYLALYCFISVALCDDCNNPLLATYNLTGLNQPTSGSGLPYCKTLKAGQTCCSSTTVATFQDKINSLVASMQNLSAIKDRSLVNARDSVLPNLKQNLQTMKNSVSQLSSQMPGDASLAAASTSFQAFDAQVQAITNAVEAIKAAFNDYQKSRTVCAVELLKLQASAYCLACDPAYASKGVTDGNTVPLSDRACRRLQSACYGYVSGSSSQGALLTLINLNNVIRGLNAAFQKLANNDSSGMTDLTTVLASILTPSTDPNLQTSDSSGCTSTTSCNWVCTNFFKNGQIDIQSFTAGGKVAGTARLLEEDEEELVSVVKTRLSQYRVLQSGQWDPDQDEAGVTVTFSDDPGNVKNPSSSSGGFLMSSITCVGILFAIFMA